MFRRESTVDKKLVEETGLEFKLENWDVRATNGRFKLSYNNVKWECLWISGTKNKLVVCLSAAGRRIRDLPRFNRWSYQDIFDCCFLCIEDPMYRKYHVPTGWFLGDANHDYCDDVADIVDYVKKKSDIDEVLFYSSSSGGTAAIRIACKLHYGTVVAICPQLDILLHHSCSVSAIERIIGVSIAADSLERNKVIEGMRDEVNRDVNFILIENIASDIDNKQVQRIAQTFNKAVKYGVNYLSDNIFMWTYEADDGLDAHSTQEWRALLPFILGICDEYIREGRVSKAAVNYINELWYDHFQNQKTINELNKLKMKGDFFLIGTNVCCGGGRMWTR